MREYVGFDYNKAGNLEEKYLYSIETGELETIKNVLCYYSHHTPEEIAQKYPHFLTEDFKKILETLENIIKWEE